MRSQDPFIGRDILDGQFQILQKIGAGGMGSVYKALQPAMNRMVAVKILHPKLTVRKDLASRFRREARAMSHLAHPNTAKVFLYGELDDGSLYIVMEFLEGRNMNQTVRAEGPMSLERAVPILVQICGALEEAHRAGIIHRDLKPENLFLSQQGGMKDYAKVLDFGLAKVTEREMRPGSVMLTQEGMVFGTPEFMSPEQAQGKKLTPASDLYSLAVILYEALTGKLPFEARTGMEYIQLHVTGKPIPLAERAPDKSFPPLLQKVFDRAFEKSAANRFASALDFAAALEAVVEGKTELPSQLSGKTTVPVQIPSSPSPPSNNGRASGPPVSRPPVVSPRPEPSPQSTPPGSMSRGSDERMTETKRLVGLPTGGISMGLLAGVAVTFLVVGVVLAIVVMRFMSR